MDKNDYEYSGLMLSSGTYYAGTRRAGDRFFYLDMIARRGSRCWTWAAVRAGGAGLHAAGIDVDGVGNSPETLDLLF